MKLFDLSQPDDAWRVLPGTSRSQAAIMTLPPGTSTGGPDNRHETSDQWLFVISGEGAAVVEGEEKSLRQGSLALIEAGEGHEIRCTGEASLVTVNVYAPPEYG